MGNQIQISQSTSHPLLFERRTEHGDFTFYIKNKTVKLAISDRDIAEKRMSEVLKHDQ